MKKVLLLMVSILCCGMAATCTATVPTSAIAVGSAVPGMSVQALVQSYGQPQYSRDGEKLTFRNGLRAEVDDDRPGIVEEVTLRSAVLATPAGITVGMDEAAMLNAYGQADKLEYDDGAKEYTYYSHDFHSKMEFKVWNGKIIKIKCELTSPKGASAYPSTPAAPMGAPDAVRTPAQFGVTDQAFLGNWDCTNDPNSTVTIHEADPQTGGYHANFFFYRIANAGAYANISGDNLSINQGTVNGQFDFRGIFEKTPSGIRFTITESAFQYLPVGSVYEYTRRKY